MRLFCTHTFARYLCGRLDAARDSHESKLALARKIHRLLGSTEQEMTRKVVKNSQDELDKCLNACASVAIGL